jgi:hypothetical protein
MSDALPLVRKLQAEAANPDASVTNLLRIAKIAATKLNVADALVWIDRELNGYMDLTVDDLPPYRRLTGTPKGYNPYHGWQPIQFPDAKTAEKFSQAPIGLALGAIEKAVREQASAGGYSFPYPPELKKLLQDALRPPADVHIALESTQLWNIVDQVKNLILNWALELEKAGILGEDMHFSEREKGDARPITHQYIIQNVGVWGDVTDQATVTNRQSASANVDLDQVRDFLQQANAALSQLPKSAQDAARPILKDLDEELNHETPNPSKIRALLSSLRKIGEGLVGNLTAQGIIAIIKNIIGA